MIDRDRDHTTADDTATETHREPHGAASPHGAADDVAGHGHDSMHDTEALGPIDVAAWGAGALGIALGLVVAACFLVAAAARPA
jgi:hypothetical protein